LGPPTRGLHNERRTAPFEKKNKNTKGGKRDQIERGKRFYVGKGSPRSSKMEGGLDMNFEWGTTWGKIVTKKGEARRNVEKGAEIPNIWVQTTKYH